MFTVPKKGSDGRYFVKPLGRKLIQVNRITILPDHIIVLDDPKSVEMVQEIDAVNLSQAAENCESWFQRKVAPKTLEAAYKKSLSDGLMIMEPEEKTRIYTHAKELHEDQNLASFENQVVDAVLEFAGIWFSKKNFGPSWKLVQLRLKRPPKPPKPEDGYLFVEEDPDNVEEEEEF